jgi:hypothetical protein
LICLVGVTLRRLFHILPNFLATREEDGTLLNVSYIFSDLRKKACFSCGQLAYLRQYNSKQSRGPHLPTTSPQSQKARWLKAPVSEEATTTYLPLEPESQTA